jgi:hypothetical protein
MDANVAVLGTVISAPADVVLNLGDKDLTYKCGIK